MDDQQRARELLAAEYEKDAPESDIPKRLRDGSAPIMFWSDEVAIRAITAALRAAPEGFVLVPVDSVLPCGCGCYRVCCRSCGSELGGFGYDRPQGVKDV